MDDSHVATPVEIIEVMREAYADKSVRGKTTELAYAMQDRYLQLTADLVLRLFTEDNIVVVGWPQSGKSLVMKLLRFLNNLSFGAYWEHPTIVKLRPIIRRNMPIVSAYARNELKSQMHDKMLSLVSASMEYHIGDLSKLWRKHPDPLMVRRFTRGLVLMDEAHMDCPTDSIVTNFNEWNILRGRSKTIYFTLEPMQFVINDSRWFDKMLTLPVPEEYYSAVSMLESGKIFQAKNIADCEGVVGDIVGAGGERISTDPLGYIIIRMKRGKKYDELVHEITEKLVAETGASEIEIIHYNSSTADSIDIREVLHTKPRQLTIIFVKDLLRAGLSIDTSNTICMYDNAKTNSIGATINSFCGRAHGFDKSDHGTVVFCDMGAVELYIRGWEVDFNPAGFSEKQKRVLKRLVSTKSFHSRVLSPIEEPTSREAKRGKTDRGVSGREFGDSARTGVKKAAEGRIPKRLREE